MGLLAYHMPFHAARCPSCPLTATCVKVLHPNASSSKSASLNDVHFILTSMERPRLPSRPAESSHLRLGLSLGLEPGLRPGLGLLPGLRAGLWLGLGPTPALLLPLIGGAATA